jgi:hypothetical protein
MQKTFKLLGLVLFTGCLPELKPIERQKIVDIGGCSATAHCLVRTSTGLVSYMRFPIVGIEVCEYSPSNDFLLPCK